MRVKKFHRIYYLENEPKEPTTFASFSRYKVFCPSMQLTYEGDERLRKVIAFFLITLSTLTITSCNSITKPAPNIVQQTNSPIEFQTNLPSSEPSLSVNSLEQVKDALFGDWEVKRCLAFPQVSEYNNDNVKHFLGGRYKYSNNMVVSYDGTSLVKPYYRVSTISSVDFRTKYKTFLKDLGVSGNSIIRVEVFQNETSELPWEGLGNTVFIINNNKLILWNGVFLEMERVVQDSTKTQQESTKRTNLVESSNNEGKSSNNVDISKIINMTKADIIKELGGNYRVVPADVEGSLEGFKYSDIGITIAFINDKVHSIACDSSFEINGVKSGMSFNQIRQKLGDVPTEDTFIETPDHKAYRISYSFDNYIMYFLSLDSEGNDASLTILIK